VQTENILEHKMHEETYFVPQETAQLIIEAKRRKSKVVAVGTTVCRTLESVANKLENGQSGPFYGNTDLFIYPGFNFKIVEALLTNFHLPRSTLLMLVSAFSSRELILKAYREAISKRYRFYSFGDAMLLL
ncbi:MAG: S-adenosylmethionine:tRNA ribosyltransferase-isomerase, partial [Firmicutes bacterium]|nr:S-adenosylmethionine:tRNA ribosyltransferase-isomerase [Bacillota bacterium]